MNRAPQPAYLARLRRLNRPGYGEGVAVPPEREGEICLAGYPPSPDGGLARAPWWTGQTCSPSASVGYGFHLNNPADRRRIFSGRQICPTKKIVHPGRGDHPRPRRCQCKARRGGRAVCPFQGPRQRPQPSRDCKDKLKMAARPQGWSTSGGTKSSPSNGAAGRAAVMS